jgi:phosphoribosylanthranilate isomerase
MPDAEQGNRIWIKICGITSQADAQCAIQCGADSLGFNFYPGSKRYVDAQAIRGWIGELPPSICKVAILVNPGLAEAIRVSELSSIDALQLHGGESPEFCRALVEHGVRFTKAVPVTAESSLADIPSFATNTVVLDALTEEGFGGGGRTFPWTVARQFVDLHPGLRVILAGGLSPENVARAITEVRPFGVDVTSGVESSPGRKDRDRLRAFIEAARAA